MGEESRVEEEKGREKEKERSVYYYAIILCFATSCRVLSKKLILLME